jgi:uncharacterized SAM-binding protein YcdF (DUF218 family)
MTTTPTRRRRGRVLGAALLVLLLVAGLLTDTLFVHPRLEPLPARVDAIIVLGGAAVTGRKQVALALAQQHRAPVLIQSTGRGEAGTDWCLPAVPGVTVVCFYAEPNTTQGEARWIASEAARRHWTSVALVTTPDQAWRARLRTLRCFPGQVYVVTASLPARDYPARVAYQWGATVKAEVFQRGC